MPALAMWRTALESTTNLVNGYLQVGMRGNGAHRPLLAAAGHGFQAERHRGQPEPRGVPDGVGDRSQDGHRRWLADTSRPHRALLGRDLDQLDLDVGSKVDSRQ